MKGKREFFPDRNGALTVDGVDCNELIERFGTPLYAYSAQAFLSPLRELQAGLEGMDALVCFAVKANSNLAILELLADAGAGMDLVSGGELRRALLAGCPESRIVFSGVGKSREEIELALEHSLHSFNVESVAELRLIESVAKASGKKARIALRFNPDVNPKTHPYISTGLKKNKFGLERAEILEIAESVRGSSSLDLQGLSVHIGSQILTLKPFADSFERVGLLAQKLKKILGRRLAFLDLGGGLGVEYKNEKPPAIQDYCRLIRKTFGPEGRFPGYRILLEPGRQISANAGILLTRVLYRKPRRAKDFVVVDAAMNDLMRPSLYGSYHEILPVSVKARKGKIQKADVVGPVCESSDCLGSDRPLPARIDSGDALAILSAGAYGMSMSSQYNSRGRAAEVLIEDGRARLIRKRETFEDLIRQEVME